MASPPPMSSAPAAASAQTPYATGTMYSPAMTVDREAIRMQERARARALRTQTKEERDRHSMEIAGMTPAQLEAAGYSVNDRRRYDPAHLQQLDHLQVAIEKKLLKLIRPAFTFGVGPIQLRVPPSTTDGAMLVAQNEGIESVRASNLALVASHLFTPAAPWSSHLSLTLMNEGSNAALVKLDGEPDAMYAERDSWPPPLFTAVFYQRRRAVDEMLKMGYNPMTGIKVVSRGYTEDFVSPLRLAVIKQHPRLVKLLLKRIDLSEYSGEVGRVFIYAVNMNMHDIVSKMIKIIKSDMGPTFIDAIFTHLSPRSLYLLAAHRSAHMLTLVQSLRPMSVEDRLDMDRVMASGGLRTWTAADKATRKAAKSAATPWMPTPASGY